MTHSWGGKDNRDYKSYSMLADRYKKQPYPRLRLTPPEMDDLLYSQVHEAVRELLHPDISDGIAVKELYDEVGEFLRENPVQASQDKYQQ
jgi:hypothetical protein